MATSLPLIVLRRGGCGGPRINRPSLDLYAPYVRLPHLSRKLKDGGVARLVESPADPSSQFRRWRVGGVYARGVVIGKLYR